MLESTMARFQGDLDGAMARIKRATEIGQRFGHRDLIAMGIHMEGLVLIAGGMVPAGLALLDEAMTSVVAGELSQYYTGAVYCNVLEACLALADVGRASQWAEASRAWCDSLPPGAPFPGLCRVNRAEVAMLRGAWPEAVAEGARASEELMSFNPIAAAAAIYGVGEIRRRMGDLAGAEEAFGRAHGLGFEPQPGLALLRQDQGKVEAAATALRVAVAGERGNQLRRARLLAAQVDVALATVDLDTAGPAADELQRCGRSSGCPTRRPGPGCCTAPPSARRATARTRCWSCARRWRPSSAWALPPTRNGPPSSWQSSRTFLAG